MKKLYFQCDYVAGCHPQVLKRLTETNLEGLLGYGVDRYSASAKEKIKAACACPEAEVELLTGGTQTNAIVISTMLRDHEGVVSAETGHVNVHEAGAIEYTGHKVLAIPGENGKIVPSQLRAYIKDFYENESYEHMVFPGMVYVSHPTEYGTLYTKAELAEIAEICREHKIPLFLDGARLGYGLMSRESDMTLADIAQLCDVFYIGGTKVGALCGEAVVFTRGNRPKGFMTSVKKRGALIAKGRLLGVQFDTLFTDGLYFELSRHAIDMAEKLKEVFAEKGLTMFKNSPTNQQFAVLENERVKELADTAGFEIWEKYDEDSTVVRFATSWSTTEEDIEALRELL